jgi:creatine kinase
MQSKFQRFGRALAGFRSRGEAAKLVAGGILAGGSTLALCETVTTTTTTTTTTVVSSEDGPKAAPAAIAAPDMDYPPYGIAPSVRGLDDWIVVGCGDRKYFCPEKNATFAADGYSPKSLGDLSKHNNFMANFFKKEPELYEKLRERKTKNGVNLADCIKTGMDNPGHPHIMTVGVVAGDEESYEVFKEMFDPIIDARHGGYGPTAVQPTNLDLSKLSNTDIDPEMKYVLTTRVRTGRSVRGFRLPPTIGFQERRDLEALVVKALLNMEGDLKGDYFPLNGSRSYAPKPNGMSEEKEAMLRKCGNLFQEPDSTLLLASGMARHWPDGRGIFHNDSQNLFVWVNEEDHLRIVSMQGQRAKPTHEGKQIKEVTARFIRACNEVDKVLKQEGSTFMHNNHLGYILTCPSNLGTGLRAGTMVMLPKLSAKPEWKKLLGAMKLQARGTGGVDSGSTGGTWDVSNADRIGKGEVDLVNILIEGAAQLVKWETMLDAGNTAQVDAELKTVIG